MHFKDKIPAAPKLIIGQVNQIIRIDIAIKVLQPLQIN